MLEKNKFTSEKHSLVFNKLIIDFIESKNPQNSHHTKIRSPYIKYIDNTCATKLYKEFCELKNIITQTANFYKNPKLQEISNNLQKMNGLVFNILIIIWKKFHSINQGLICVKFV